MQFELVRILQQGLFYNKIMLRFLSQEPLVNGEISRTFLDRLHRQTASLVEEAAMDSMEALPFKVD